MLALHCHILTNTPHHTTLVHTPWHILTTTRVVKKWAKWSVVWRGGVGWGEWVVRAMKVPHREDPCCTVLYLYYTVLHYAILYRTVLFNGSMLTALRYTKLSHRSPNSTSSFLLFSNISNRLVRSLLTTTWPPASLYPLYRYMSIQTENEMDWRKMQKIRWQTRK